MFCWCEWGIRRTVTHNCNFLIYRSWGLQVKINIVPITLHSKPYLGSDQFNTLPNFTFTHAPSYISLSRR